MSTPRTVKGFRDYLPVQMIPRQRFIASVRESFESYGFVPLDTPAIEFSELLLSKGGEGTARQVYRFDDAGGRDLCLRYDLTVPLARVVAQHRGVLPMPFKRYQIAPVWRGEKPQKGRFREFYQCDADVVGTTALTADAEILRVGVDLMGVMGVGPFQLRISHRRMLDGVAERLGIVAEGEAAPSAFYRAIDRIDGAGLDAVRSELEELTPNLEFGLLERFLNLTEEADGGLPRTLRSLGEFFSGGAGTAAVEALAELVELAFDCGVPTEVLALDASIARGMDYYTGAIFETRALDMPEIGSVMSGGRYDGLVGSFLGKDLPAVGISLGLDRTFDGLLDRGTFREEWSTARVLVTIFDDDSWSDARSTAEELRSKGVPVLLPYERRALKKQIRSADRLGIPWVVVRGPEERGRGSWRLKNLDEGVEVEVDMAALIERVTTDV